MRSEAARAPWRMLNFSVRSRIGRKNISEYIRKATKPPTVSVPVEIREPP